MARRSQFLPWRVAGQVTDRQQSADDVVQATGWVFNSDTDDSQTLADFVASGDTEVSMYLDAFGLVDRRFGATGCSSRSAPGSDG